MNEYQQGFLQGMLDARFEMTLVDPNQVALCPFDMFAEDALTTGWWDGYNAHRRPKVSD